MTRCVVCSTSELTGEPSLALSLTFHLKEKVTGRDHGRDNGRESVLKDSYRDVFLKRLKDGKDLAHHKKKMSELVALILLLREEAVNTMLSERTGGPEVRQRNDAVDM